MGMGTERAANKSDSINYASSGRPLRNLRLSLLALLLRNRLLLKEAEATKGTIVGREYKACCPRWSHLCDGIFCGTSLRHRFLRRSPRSVHVCLLRVGTLRMQQLATPQWRRLCLVEQRPRLLRDIRRDKTANAGARHRSFWPRWRGGVAAALAFLLIFDGPHMPFPSSTPPRSDACT